MSYTTSSREVKEQREKEKAIKEFNEELKNSPALLNNALYLVKNMFKVRLKLKQLPEKYKDNLLLITEYFKTERESINFKYIKPEILNNELFLSFAMKYNPELYFLISEDNKNIFKETAIANDKDYLKYLSKEDYDKPEIIKKVALNFKNFNESLSCISEEILKKLLNSEYIQHVEKDILRLDKQQCNYLKEALTAYIKENGNKGEYWFQSTLNSNPYLYTILDKEDYKDNKNKEFLLSLTSKYNNLFVYLPEEWKNDIEVIAKIITTQSTKQSYYYNHGTDFHNKVQDISIILNQYDSPEKFITEKLNDTTMLSIRKIYPHLTENWRKQPLIIKSLFKGRDDFEIDLDYCRSIPNKDLAENLVIQMKALKERKLSEIGDTLEKLVLYQFLQENLSNKNTKEKKLKI